MLDAFVFICGQYWIIITLYIYQFQEKLDTSHRIMCVTWGRSGWGVVLSFWVAVGLTVAPSMQQLWPSSKAGRWRQLAEQRGEETIFAIAKCKKKSWILGLRIPTASYICTGCPYTNNLNTYNLRTQNVGFCGNSSPFASHAIWVSRSWLSGALSPCWDGVRGMIWRGLFDAAFQGWWWSSYYATMLWCLMIFGYFELL